MQVTATGVDINILHRFMDIYRQRLLVFDFVKGGINNCRRFTINDII